MEALIILAVIYFIFQAIVKSRRETAGQAGNSRGFTGTGADIAQKARTQQANSHKETYTPLRSDTFPASEPRMPYQPIQPTTHVSNSFTAYSGSMGGQPTEGTASGEGNRSTEGATVTEGGEVFTSEVLNQNWQTMQAYAIGHSGDDVARVLPENWNRDALVQAIVAQEILNTPHRRRVYHG